MLVDALNDDADAFGDVERDARALYESLRARRIAAKLANVEGRTPEEAAAFLAKAEELSPRAHVSERSPVRVPDEQEQP